MKIGRHTVKNHKGLTWYNLLIHVKYPITNYEVIRIGQALAVKVKLFGLTLGIYWY